MLSRFCSNGTGSMSNARATRYLTVFAVHVQPQLGVGGVLTGLEVGPQGQPQPCQFFARPGQLTEQLGDPRAALLRVQGQQRGSRHVSVAGQPGLPRAGQFGDSTGGQRLAVGHPEAVQATGGFTAGHPGVVTAVTERPATTG